LGQLSDFGFSPASPYPHALDRVTLLLGGDAKAPFLLGEKANIYRIDQQMIAMADHFLEIMEKIMDLGETSLIWVE